MTAAEEDRIDRVMWPHRLHVMYYLGVLVGVLIQAFGPGLWFSMLAVGLGTIWATWQGWRAYLRVTKGEE